MSGGVAIDSVVTNGSGSEEQGISVKSLSYAFSGGQPFLNDFSLDLPKGSRCLLMGANGAGKTTLLQIMAGKYMVSEDAVRVIGRPPFHDMKLTCDGELSFLGSTWRRDVAFAGYDLPLQGDIGAEQMIMSVKDVDPERRKGLIEMLDVDLKWRMNKVSDGQRRRVQICMGLLKPYKVLLLDEITVDMDVVGRLDLLDFFTQECEQRGATIVYATHILDGLEPWMTHCALLADGKLRRGGPVGQVEGIKDGKLMHVVYKWLKEERDARKAHEAIHGKKPSQHARKAPKMPSRHLAYFG